MQQKLNYSNSGQSRDVLVDPPRRNGTLPLKLVVGSASMIAFSSTGAQGVTLNPQHFNQTATTISVIAREEDYHVPSALLEIKDASGLTWAQIAKLLKSSRRTVANWMDGRGIKATNETQVFELRDRVQSLAHLPGYQIRNHLLGTGRHEAVLRRKIGDRVPLESDNTPLAGGAIALEDNTLEILE